VGIDATWTALLRSTLDSAHVARFGGAPQELVERARASALGRRMLAQRLQSESQPLFTLESADDCAWVTQHPWALFSGERLRGTAFDLGALAFAPALRSKVNRRDVLALREALGIARLSFALAADPWQGAAAPEAVSHCAMAGLARVLGKPEAIAELVRQRGRIELYAYSANLHPLLGERIKLAFPPLSAGERSDAWLPAATVAQYLVAGASAAETRQ